MRISDWSSDVCSSDLRPPLRIHRVEHQRAVDPYFFGARIGAERIAVPQHDVRHLAGLQATSPVGDAQRLRRVIRQPGPRSEEHTSELQSLMRISYAVFCLKKIQTKKHSRVY